jgi:hypothetical protein
VIIGAATAIHVIIALGGRRRRAGMGVERTLLRGGLRERDEGARGNPRCVVLLGLP